MATDTVKLILDTKATGDGAAKTKRGLGGIEKAAKLAAGAFALMKTAQVAVDFIKFGADLQRQAASLEGLAQAAGTSGDAIVDAMQRASDFTIDKMSAMQVSNRALMMDVAKTPEEFERLTRVARRLGQAMGMDATKSIDDFITAAGRQSMMIADNLGLTVRQEDAYKSWAIQIGKTADSLTDAEKKQAFLNAMLVAGEIKVAEMGDATMDAAGKIEVLSAAAMDMKAGLADMAVGFLDSVINVEKFAAGLRMIPETLKKITMLAQGVDDVARALFRGDDAAEAFQHGVRMAYYASQDFLETFEDGEPIIDGWMVTMGMAGTQAVTTAGELGMTKEAMDNLLIAQEKGIETGFQLEQIADGYTGALGGQITATEDLVAAMGELTGPAFTEQTSAIMGMEATYDSWVKTNEEVLESYKSLIFEGIYGTQIAMGDFSEEAGAMAVGLGLMTSKQASMMVEASDMSRLLGDALIDYGAQLEALSPEQLNDFIELLASGETGSVLGALAIVTESMRADLTPEIEEIAKKAAARLPTVERKFREVSNEIIDNLEPSIRSLKEPVITFGTVTDAAMKQAKTAADHAYKRIKDIDRALNAITSQQHNVQINVTTTGDFPNYQHGTLYHPGGLAMVGEAGPELVMLPRGSKVYSGASQHTTQRAIHYNRPQTVYVQDTAAVGMLLEQQRKAHMRRVGSNL